MATSESTVPSASPNGPAPFGVGEVVADKYRIDRVVGIGGMAIVFAAHHLELDQPVAIKALLPEHAASKELVQRFLTEARAAAKLKSVHVARISDVATVASRIGPLPIIVMELLDGEDLSNRLVARGRLSAAQAMDFVLQACDAVAEAHALGIVHRDLKPSNLFVVERRDGAPVIKLLDFGISKTSTPVTGGNVERSSAKKSDLTGTPAYMSPEQVRCDDVDGRTDIWALGVILHELLTGQDPFTGDDMDATLKNVVRKAPPSIASLAPEVPPPVISIVDRCLEKKPEQRFQTISELTIALSEALGELSISGIHGTARIASAANVDLSMTTRPAIRSSSTRNILLGSFLALGVAGLTLVIAFAVVRARAPIAEAHPATPTTPESAAPLPPPPPPLPPPQPALEATASAAPSPSSTPSAAPTTVVRPAFAPRTRPKRSPSPSDNGFRRTDW